MSSFHPFMMIQNIGAKEYGKWQAENRGEWNPRILFHVNDFPLPDSLSEQIRAAHLLHTSQYTFHWMNESVKGPSHKIIISWCSDRFGSLWRREKSTVYMRDIKATIHYIKSKNYLPYKTATMEAGLIPKHMYNFSRLMKTFHFQFKSLDIGD